MIIPEFIYGSVRVLKQALITGIAVNHGSKIEKEKDKYEQPCFFGIAGDRQIICIFEFVDTDGENVDQPAESEKSDGEQI